MLFDEPVLFFKGLTIFRDFSELSRYYFLPPEAPRVARSAENSEDYALRLVLYRPDPNAPPPQGMENGGGFLNLDVDLHVDNKLLEQATQEVQRRFGGTASLVPVPFLRGSVELLLLGVGREDQGKPFVRKVAGSTVPSLYGSQRAAFSVVLDRDGAALMEQVIKKGGMTMVLATYHLAYAGIPPAYNLRITVDYEKVYEHLDLRIQAGVTAKKGQSSFVGKAGFHMLMEELREKRVVNVDEVDPVPGENGRTPVDQARIDEIIGNLMGSKWFKPTLASTAQMADLGSSTQSQGGTGAGSSQTPGTQGTSTPGGGSSGGTGSTTPAAGQRQTAQWQEDSKTPTPFPADRGVESFQPSTSGTRETLTVRGTGATAKAGPQPNALQLISLNGNQLSLDVAEGETQHIEIKWPAGAGTAAGSGSGATTSRAAATWTQAPTEGPSDGRGVEPFQVSANGTSENLVIRGEGATVKVGNSPATLAPHPSPGNRATVDVPAGETRHVEITWPGGSVGEETFHLFFDNDRPIDRNNDVGKYKEGRPDPSEPDATLNGEHARFLEQSRSNATATPQELRGPAALNEWLATLDPNSTLTLDAHASWEDRPPTGREGRRQANRSLSERRLAVARHLVAQHPISSRMTIANGNGTGVFHGSDVAESNPRAIPQLPGDTVLSNANGGQTQHRVVLIRGTKRGTAQTIIRGQLRRDPSPNQPVPPPGQGTPESILRGHVSRGKGGGDFSVQASFEINLEMIQREERVTAVYNLSTRKARVQEVHPQGNLILDVLNPADYIIEADGALDFFQRLDIAASTTAQWDKEGIDSIGIQIRYAPREGGFRRSGDIVLSKDRSTGLWKSGVLREDEDNSRSPVLYWYEYRITVHYLPDVAMGDQSGAVTSVGVKGADPEGWIRSTERNLVIHPRDVTPAIMVNITTGLLRFDLLQRAQVVLTYGPHRQNIALSADHAEHRLLIRPEAGLEDARLRTEGKLFYKDGAQVPLPPQDWSPQELIVINEPRENILRVQVILADPGNDYQKVKVRLRYEHGNRVVEETRELTTHAQMEEWAVRLENPSVREWKYQAILIKKSGDIDTTDWIDGPGNQLILGVRAVDVIPVQVVWLIPPAGDTIAVKIDLRYIDAANGVRWEQSELIRGQHSGEFTWSIAIADSKKRSYDYRVTEFTRSSGAKEGPWTPSDQTMLVLPS
mgnify:CR=1 FL=1